MANYSRSVLTREVLSTEILKQVHRIATHLGNVWEFEGDLRKYFCLSYALTYSETDFIQLGWGLDVAQWDFRCCS